ncbi:MAG TPA: extracellular solute-binding protein [Acetobacteraceae bacterium]|nr:extracellular solute-binding protein [Acetobacteraceae bacterium]
MRGFLCVLALLAAATSARAAEIDPALVAAATKEGTVVWYTGMIVNQIVRPVVAAFEAKYPGIKVEASRASGNDNALKIMNEARARHPLADVVDSTTALPPLMKAGLVAKFIPTESARYPANAKDPAGYWTSPNVYYYTAAYNTKLVSAADAPKTYDDLLDPKWKGKMAWTYDLTGGGPPGFIHNILTIKGQEKGMEYLRAFAKQEPAVIPASQRVVLDKVISGEYPLALMTLSYHSTISAAKGAPVQWLKMPPMVMSPNVISLLKYAPHPNAGKLLIEFILSTEAQKIMAANDYMPADPAVAAKDPELQPEHGHFAVTVISPEQTRDDLPKWIAIYHELFR